VGGANPHKKNQKTPPKKVTGRTHKGTGGGLVDAAVKISTITTQKHLWLSLEGRRGRSCRLWRGCPREKGTHTARVLKTTRGKE